MTKLFEQIHLMMPEVVIFDSAPILCDSVKCPIAKGNNFLYSYGDHISDESAKIIVSQLLNKIQF
jgi:hypothetical protein